MLLDCGRSRSGCPNKIFVRDLPIAFAADVKVDVAIFGPLEVALPVDNINRNIEDFEELARISTLALIRHT